MLDVEVFFPLLFLQHFGRGLVICGDLSCGSISARGQLAIKIYSYHIFTQVFVLKYGEGNLQILHFNFQYFILF